MGVINGDDDGKSLPPPRLLPLGPQATGINDGDGAMLPSLRLSLRGQATGVVDGDDDDKRPPTALSETTPTPQAAKTCRL